MTWWKWSRTAATNATADSTINWAEGQAPSSVNDSARAMMAAAAKYRDDIAGAIATAGTSTAYTLTSYEVFDSLAHMDGAVIAFTPHATNGAAPTLAVDGLTAKPIRLAPSIDIQVGSLVLGAPYVVLYNNSDGAFYLRNAVGSSSLQSRLAASITYQSTTTLAPTGLSVNLSAGRTYAIDVWLMADGGGVAAGLKAALSGTATITDLAIRGLLWSGQSLINHSGAVAFDNAFFSNNGTGASLTGLAKGTITVNAAGTMTVTAAQSSSSPDTLTILREVH